jgi:hypothetical protein
MRQTLACFICPPYVLVENIVPDVTWQIFSVGPSDPNAKPRMASDTLLNPTGAIRALWQADGQIDGVSDAAFFQRHIHEVSAPASNAPRALVVSSEVLPQNDSRNHTMGEAAVKYFITFHNFPCPSPG